MRKIPIYNHPAAGWSALIASTRKLMDYKAFLRGSFAMLSHNQPKGGFDCPGCAWPDHKTHKTLDICETGIKVIASETMSTRADSAFFAKHTVLNYKAGQVMSLSIADDYQSHFIMMQQ